jgi:hypothetical protein
MSTVGEGADWVQKTKSDHISGGAAIFIPVWIPEG